MGNALRFLRRCFESQPAAPPPAPAQPQGSLSVSALARDLFHFEISSQVPDGLSQYVVSSKKAQSKWYGKLLVAWKEARPPPWTEEDAARLVVQALKGHRKVDVEGLLSYYGLPIPEPVPESGKVELHTLPVEYKDVGDGDTINVYVSATTPRESAAIPLEVSRAAAERSQARAARDFPRADALLKTIQTAGYRVNDGHVCGSALEKKYRIRLRGIDAPEMAMPYGKEAKEALAKMVHGKSLKVILYEEDRYGRHVGDVYCDGIFAQEAMLRLGFAWHYVAYDKRPELAMWEKEARSARRGLWASRNPEKPWEWRREKRNGG